MADSSFYNFIDDIGIFGGFVCIHSFDKEISQPTNEYVSEQDGVKLRNINRAKVKFICGS